MSELRSATKNFGSNSYLGEGGFGCVYKGWIDEGRMVAIKKLRKESFQGHREWLAEVTYLGELHHDNLVKLVGYCSDSDSNKVLVYEYMLRGSLENHLFRRGTQPLSWPMRLSIAVDVARGMAFLHGQESPVIFRDLKSSNVLLDSDYRAKLSDFGLARDGPTGDRSHVSTRVVGTRGYAAPEYIATGHLSVKSDMYSFGVVLLELLTGRRALDEPRGSTLVDWAKPKLKLGKQVIRIMDTRLGGQYSKRQAQEVAALALRCLDDEAKNRPAMDDHVLPELQRLLHHNKSGSSTTPVRTTGRRVSSKLN
ncbi:hypothetical protein HU200_012684 [Digitaria exilis]|uniref:Protein kinase domain-containing protein n=1 Tax=Digitaria exilis TaxID=1010633 RepID=A0A835KKA0_9POAL|nr:hypothetical protein HU200_012684 [Digitaria exilis]